MRPEQACGGGFPMKQVRGAAVLITELVFTGLVLLAATGYCQSLGDVARQERQKQAAKDPNSPPKVITNDDMPSTPDLSSSSSRGRHEDLSAHHQQTAQQWKAQIQSQMNRIAALERQIDQMQRSIHFVAVPLYSGGVRHNEQQLQKEENVKRMQADLENLKQQLEDTQEAARRDGYSSAVYEP